jgi:ribosomal protein L15
MKLKKRTIRSRLRGAKTCGYGFRQQHKGHGNKGGFGMSGTGKRASQKQQKALMMAKEAGFKTYFGKQGMTSASTAKKKTYQLNLQDIQKNYSGTKIDLKKYKILAKGDGFKAEISAMAASKSAIEKMEKAGGKIIIVEKAKKKESEKK